MSVLPFRAPDPPEPTRPITIARIVADYLADQQPELQPQTFADRKRVCDLFAAAFGDRAPDAIRPSEVKAWIMAQPAWKSANTRRKKHNALKAVFAWAVKDRLIDRDPLAGHALPAGERRPLTSEAELRQMLKLGDPPFRRYVLFLRLTGCRPEDGRSADWEWLDWQRRLIVVPADKHKTGRRSKKAKLIVLTTPAFDLVCWLHRNRPEPLFEATGPILCNSHGKRWTATALNQRMRQLRSLGLPRTATLHGLRHTFTTAGLAHGAGVKQLSTVIGHAQSSTTEQFYSHLGPDQLELLHQTAELGARRMPSMGRSGNPSAIRAGTQGSDSLDNRRSPNVPSGT